MLPQPIVDALQKASDDKLIKVLIIDADGNVVSANLTKLADALQSVGTDKLLVVLSEDDVGIAKDATLNKIVNALQSVGTDKLLIDISEDDVGIAKDATLNKIVNALQSVGTDKLLTVISEDDVGIAKDTTLTNLFSPVSNNGSVSATANTAGLTVSLNKGGRPSVNIYYNVGGACTIYVEVSVDNSTWRTLDTITTTGAKESVEQYPWVAYPYIRVRTPTTGISVEFEIVASR